jgi:hypothetical protein
LERLSRSRTAAQRHVEHVHIILGWLAGQRPAVTAEQVGCHVTTVYYQLRQFNARGRVFLAENPSIFSLEGPLFRNDQITQAIELATQHWNARHHPYQWWRVFN